MKLAHKLLLLFVPHQKNNQRALLLQPGFLGIMIAIYLLNQSILRSLSTLKPGILGYSSEITANKVIDFTNQERSKLGLPTLTLNSNLSQSASLKAQDMFANKYWAHTSPSGKSPWDFFKTVNYRYSIAGENLAKDFYDTDSMMKAWMNSPTHRSNIVNTKFKEIGIGVVNGVLNGVETTLVVQHFGTPITTLVATKTDQPVNQVAPAAPPVAKEEIVVEQVSAPAVVNTQVLASQARFNPLVISKIIGGTMFVLILTVLVIDTVVTMRRKTYRLSASSAGHISFLAIIFLLLLFSRQGSIF